MAKAKKKTAAKKTTTKKTTTKSVKKETAKKAAVRKTPAPGKSKRRAAAEAPKVESAPASTTAETKEAAPASTTSPGAPASPPSNETTKRRCVKCGRSITDHAPNCTTVVATPAEIAAATSKPPTEEMVEARRTACVCKDFHGHTCIELRRIEPDEEAKKLGARKVVQYIPLLDGAFDVREMNAYQFDKTYKEIEGYLVERAAKLYTGYSQFLGATEEAMTELSRLVNVSPKEKENAMAKKPGIATATKTTKKDSAVEKEKASMKAVKTGTSSKAAAPKKDAAPRESAADMFRTLIMEGKLTDDQIFAKVKAKFGLEDKKRSYVAWYRNDLKKKGKKPPEAKEPSKKAA